MNKLSLLATALIFTSIAHAEPTKVKLWPEGAPLAKGNEDKDQPFINVWSAAKEKANGAAFVVCPGGGYGGLAADHEGVQVAKWFNGIGVSAFVLHYRLGTNGYHFPTQLIDVQRAIRHVRANAKGMASTRSASASSASARAVISPRWRRRCLTRSLRACRMMPSIR